MTEKEKTPYFKPAEFCQAEQWYKITLVFAQTSGKHEEFGDWVKLPIRVNNKSYNWFLKPDYQKDAKFLQIFSELKIQPGNSFEFCIFPYLNPDTKKPSTQWGIRAKGKEMKT